MTKPTYEFTVVLMRETPKALLLVFNPGEHGKEQWVPKSVVASFDKKNSDPNDDECTASIHQWWCEKNGVEPD